MVIQRILMEQPETNRSVFEFGVAGWLGKKLRAKDWYAVTLPMPFCSFILYWFKSEEEIPDPYKRVHEFTHVAQKDRPGPFYVQYFKAMLRHRKGKLDEQEYYDNDLEVEAYAAEEHAHKFGLPEWAA